MTRRERSYLLPRLTKADRELLAELPRQATLADEIDFLRLRLAHLAGEDDAKPEILVRILSLLTRMVEVQAKVGVDHGDVLAELRTLVSRRLTSAEDQPAVAEAR